MSGRSSPPRTWRRTGVRLRAPVHPGADRAQHRVDRAPVRAGWARATELGFAREQVEVIDEDLGVSGSGEKERQGFWPASRLRSRSVMQGWCWDWRSTAWRATTADWYRLLDLCGGDRHGDRRRRRPLPPRLLQRPPSARPQGDDVGGRAAHAARPPQGRNPQQGPPPASCACELPVGLVWGEADGEVLFDPDEAGPRRDRGDLRALRAASSARRARWWLVAVPRERGLLSAAALSPGAEIRWVQTLLPPGALGAHQPRLRGCLRLRTKDAAGSATSTRMVGTHPQPSACRGEEWQVLIWDHHPGFVDREDLEANGGADAPPTKRPRAHEAGGAVREGSALLQGIAVCGRCGSSYVHYDGRRGRKGRRLPLPWLEQRPAAAPGGLPAGRRREDRRGGRRCAARGAHAGRGSRRFAPREGRARGRP